MWCSLLVGGVSLFVTQTLGWPRSAPAAAAQIICKMDDPENEPLMEPQPRRPSRSYKRKKLAVSLAFGLAVATLIGIVIGAWFTVRTPTAGNKWATNGRSRPITRPAFEKGVALCASFSKSQKDDVPSVTGEARTHNPRFSLGAKSQASQTFLIKNATLWDGESKSPRYALDVVFSKGVIRAIGANYTISDVHQLLGSTEEVVTLDVEGRYVTPGLVDQHSHAGVGSWPYLEAGEDVNEMTESATLPQLRSLDGLE